MLPGERAVRKREQLSRGVGRAPASRRRGQSVMVVAERETQRGGGAERQDHGRRPRGTRTFAGVVLCLCIVLHVLGIATMTTLRISACFLCTNRKNRAASNFKLSVTPSSRPSLSKFSKSYVPLVLESTCKRRPSGRVPPLSKIPACPSAP